MMRHDALTLTADHRTDEKKRNAALMWAVAAAYRPPIDALRSRLKRMTDRQEYLTDAHGWNHDGTLAITATLHQGLASLHARTDTATQLITQSQHQAAHLGSTLAAALLAAAGVADIHHLSASREARIALQRPDGVPFAHRLHHENANLIARLHATLLGHLTYDPSRRVVAAMALLDAFWHGTLLHLAQNERTRVYNSALAETYTENASASAYWQWIAELGPRCCAGCIDMHGTIHPVSEPFSLAHNNCQCCAMPIVDPARPTITVHGTDWFDAQPDTVQRHILGPAMHTLYQQNLIGLDDVLSRPYTAWGIGAVPKSIEALVREGTITAQHAQEAYRAGRMVGK